MIRTGGRGRTRPSRWVIGLFTAVVALAVVGGVPAHAVTGGAPVTDGSKGFVAKLQIGDITSCAGALVAPQWVLSSASCFVTAAGAAPGGPPPVRTLVTLGRNNLTGTGGHTALAIKLVPNTNRDLILVQLDTAITDVAPIALASGAPAVGDTLRTATFGRTATVWAPNQLQTAQFTVSAVNVPAVGLAGSSATVSLCKGDAGGPVFSETGGSPALVALDTLARDNGCLDSSETRTGATATLVTDLGSWIQSVTATSPNGYFVPVTPTRILDTRNGNGTSGNTTTPVPANTGITLQITGKNGVPAKDVLAVALTVTSTGQSGNGIVTVYPDQVTRPVTSNLNYAAGPAVANFVVVPVGANGAVDLYSAGSSTHLIADLAGYFTDDYSTVGVTTYMPIIPKRFLDTRNGTGTTGGRPGGGGTVTVTIGGVNSIPTANVTAVAVNLTAVSPTNSGYLIPWAHGTTQPAVSGLQYQASTNQAISAIVPLSADGKFDIYTTASTDLLADVTGYFTTDGTGMTFHPATPTRLEDTRDTGVPIPANGTAAKPPFAGGAIAGAGGTQPIPIVISTSPVLQEVLVSSVPLLNVTVAAPAGGGYIENYPYGASAGATSAIQFSPGQIVPDLIFADVANTNVRPAPNPETFFFNGSAATVNLVYDYYGSFTKDAAINGTLFGTDGSIVEDGSYPGAAAIEAAEHVHLISGDGHILLVACPAMGNPTGVITVHTTDNQINVTPVGQLCFQVTGPAGRLNLQVSGVHEIHGDYNLAHHLTAELVVEAGDQQGQHQTVAVPSDGSLPVGVGAGGPSTMLLQLVVQP